MLLFLLLNVVAFLHAWRFTHFTDGKDKKPVASETGWGQKIKYAFTGMPNPRPENSALPQVSYDSIVLNDNYSTACWWIKADSAKGTVILLHGYGGEKSSMLDKSELFRAWGYNTLLVDFRGSGNTPGNATSIGYHEAKQVLSAFEWVKKQSDDPIFVFGTSMGAAAAMRAVAEYNISPNGLMIECPFGTLYKTTKARFKQMGIPSFPMASLLVFWGGIQQGFNGFNHNPTEYAKKITVPTLLMYGKNDPKVTLEETEEIFQHLKGEKTKTYFDEAGHENYLIRYKKEWEVAVSRFLKY